MSIKEITSLILQRHQSALQERPFIVAIDGLSGAGKTTLVKKLERELKYEHRKVSVFHIDDHIVERDKRYHTGHEEWYEYYYLQWDVEELKRQLFEELHGNIGTLTLSFYDKAADHIVNKHVTVERDDIVLVEGIFLQREEWRRFFDLILFLDCPRELRYERALNRDLYIGDYEERLAKYKRRYWLGEDHYVDTESPVARAHVVCKATDLGMFDSYHCDEGVKDRHDE
ncbi:kinase [Bacillus sp. FSL W7-1360]